MNVCTQDLATDVVKNGLENLSLRSQTQDLATSLVASVLQNTEGDLAEGSQQGGQRRGTCDADADADVLLQRYQPADRALERGAPGKPRVLKGYAMLVCVYLLLTWFAQQLGLVHVNWDVFTNDDFHV